MGGGTGGNAVASVFIGDRMQVILTQQIYPIQSIYALDTASSDIAMARSNVVCSRYQETNHTRIIFPQFLFRQGWVNI